jgi:hypothetical protein
LLADRRISLLRPRALVAAIVAAASLAGPLGAEPAEARQCGRVAYEAWGQRVSAPVRAGRVSCRQARRVVRYALRHTRGNAYVGPRGWGCARGSEIGRAHV